MPRKSSLAQIARALSGSVVACAEGEQCKYGPQRIGEAYARCPICCLSPEAGDAQRSYWRPLEKGAKHPQLEAQRRQAYFEAQSARRTGRKLKSKTRQRILTLANKAERTTERALIQATKNSGRSHQDGDHLCAQDIVLDTKNQSTRIHPTINLSELEKVRQQAHQNGHPIGALVIRNKHDIGVVVLAENDFARLIHSLVEPQVSVEPATHEVESRTGSGEGGD